VGLAESDCAPNRVSAFLESMSLERLGRLVDHGVPLVTRQDLRSYCWKVHLDGSMQPRRPQTSDIVPSDQSSATSRWMFLKKFSVLAQRVSREISL